MCVYLGVYLRWRSCAGPTDALPPCLAARAGEVRRSRRGTVPLRSARMRLLEGERQRRCVVDTLRGEQEDEPPDAGRCGAQWNARWRFGTGQKLFLASTKNSAPCAEHDEARGSAARHRHEQRCVFYDDFAEMRTTWLHAGLPRTANRGALLS
ncbi:hypothetical protein TRVL_05320 [Trypanosoma vivax]|nr:hypothetical protein TRVL_05320 [Trypanosoma vivax]